MLQFNSIKQLCLDMQSPTRLWHDDGAIELFLINASEYPQQDRNNMHWASDIQAALINACHCGSVKLRLSPHSFVFYYERADFEGQSFHVGGDHHSRLFDCASATRHADLLRIVLDHLENTRFNRLLSRIVDAELAPVVMANELAHYMQQRHKAGWDFYFYTGSMISAFIDSMGALNPCLTCLPPHTSKNITFRVNIR